jgi:hypothetical protein
LTAAFFYQNLGQLGPAETFLHKVLAVDPENPTARINQARLLDEIEQARARLGPNRLEGR